MENNGVTRRERLALRPRLSLPLAASVMVSRPLLRGEFSGVGLATLPLVLSDSQYAAIAVRPAVVDTNALRSDLLRACSSRFRTAFLDAGSGGLRFLCPDHVVAEMNEHLPEFVDGITDLNTARTIFEQHYMPILRVVTVPPGPLASEEAARLARLAMIDPDDVPTARLALLLHAPVLTKDKSLLRAVHGEDADIESLAEWLDLALAGRALGEGDQQMLTTVLGFEALARAGVAGAEQLVRALRTLPPALQLAIIVATIGTAVFARRPIADFIGTAGRGLLDAVGPMVAAWGEERQLAFAWMQAARPPLGELAACGDAMLQPTLMPANLARACLYVLARARVGLTMVQLASTLRISLQIPATDAQVYQVLRVYGCFQALLGGRWQVGRTWPSAGARLPSSAAAKTVPRLVPHRAELRPQPFH